jgi:polyhydroxybutyrate depolymerase
MNGTMDPFVPYEGGEVTPTLFPRLSKMLRKPSRGKVISTDATIEFWLRHNGIDGKDLVTTLPDLDKTDESTAKRTEWTNENTGVSVVLYTILGGGHTWPGAKQYLPVQTIGPTNQDIHASEIIWNFFAQHPKNGSPK